MNDKWGQFKRLHLCESFVLWLSSVSLNHAPSSNERGTIIILKLLKAMIISKLLLYLCDHNVHNQISACNQLIISAWLILWVKLQVHCSPILICSLSLLKIQHEFWDAIETWSHVPKVTQVEITEPEFQLRFTRFQSSYCFHYSKLTWLQNTWLFLTSKSPHSPAQVDSFIFTILLALNCL